AVVNAGAVVMRPGSGQAPDLCTNSKLLYGEELENQSGDLMSEQLIALQRDLMEREMMIELALPVPGLVVTFTDGPLELWSTGAEDAREFALFQARYVEMLKGLAERGAVTAGYIDKPGANLVVRMLELATLPDAELHDQHRLRAHHPFRGVDDRLLFGGASDMQPVIFPGQRSAVFCLQSTSQNVYTGPSTLHFFYLNVGSSNHPYIVRVEIPQWVAADPAKLDLLHAALIAQCGIMGYKPYPYLLHRAHETAVVRYEERPMIEQLLQLEFNRHGEAIREKSHKQTPKDLPGRKSI
ncbi:MAG TPA: DNA double-strand break repair nuclease NurA, partial [Anaerolineales bacterium]|nr:DNA double-strand break repair nuclease NurA [Anaerolineales bacterium]